MAYELTDMRNLVGLSAVCITNDQEGYLSLHDCDVRLATRRIDGRIGGATTLFQTLY